MKIAKTNALRLLDQKKMKYEIETYEFDEEHLSGQHILDQITLSEDETYKTLVLKGNKDYIVCCIPILKEIDLKKLAKASLNKSVEMIHQKDLLSITGYMRGGCSPLGMKKKFVTYFQKDIMNVERVGVSAGKRGIDVILDPKDLIKMVDGILVDVVRDEEG